MTTLKRLILLFALLAPAKVAMATFAPIGTPSSAANCKKNNSAGTGTLTLNTIGALEIKIGAVYATGSTPVVADDYNGMGGTNTIAAGTPNTASAFETTRIYTIVAPMTGATHAFSLTGTGTFAQICVVAFSGTGTSSAIDQVASGSYSSGSPNAVGSVTPTTTNQLIFVMAGFSGSVSGMGITGGFVTPLFSDFVSSNSYGIAISWLIQTTIAAANPSFTFTGVVDTVSSGDTNKQVTGGGPSVVPVIVSGSILQRALQ